MKYTLTINQIEDGGSVLEVAQDKPFSEENLFLIPNVGDTVSYFLGDETSYGTVLSRHFELLKDTRNIIIVVEPIEPSALRGKHPSFN